MLGLCPGLKSCLCCVQLTFPLSASVSSSEKWGYQPQQPPHRAGNWHVLARTKILPVRMLQIPSVGLAHSLSLSLSHLFFSAEVEATT